MTVVQLARKVSIPAEIVRYYTRIGLLKPERHQENGYRLFSFDDIKRLKFILRAKGLGFTLSEISQILDHAENHNSPCPLVRDLITCRIKENRERLDAMAHLQIRMEKALAQWKVMPDGMPNGHSVCHLIEAMDEQGQE